MVDVVVIGSGIMGAAVSRELSKYNLDIIVLEKEHDVSNGTTKANSAIIHAGYDAQNGTQSALTGTIFNIYYILLFFAVDGHLALMKILIESGQVIPYGMAVVTRGSAQAILTIFSECVVLAVKLALPMIAIQFLVEIAVGILMKIIPQINIFILSIQLKIIIGFIMLFVLISPIGSMFGTIVTQMMNEMIYVLKTATT